MDHRTRILSVLLAAGVSVVGCQTNDRAGGKGPSEQAPSRPAGEPNAHAPARAKPGSHEDWCGEHAVPESLCTQCNPALVAAFKATGDWCEEHGLPESQCRICNPSLKIERPPELAKED